MPGVPTEKWSSRSSSQFAVRRYGTILLSDNVLHTIPKLSQFINELMSNPPPTTIAEYRGNILRTVTEASLSSIRVNVSLDDIQRVAMDNPASLNTLLSLNTIMQVLSNYVK